MFGSEITFSKYCFRNLVESYITYGSSNDKLAKSCGNYELTDCTFNVWSNGSHNSVIFIQR